MKMKLWRLIAAVVLICVGTANAQQIDGEAKKKLAIAGAAVGKAIHEHDIAALEKLWSPELLVNNPNNHVLTRAEVFDAIEDSLTMRGNTNRPLKK